MSAAAKVLGTEMLVLKSYGYGEAVMHTQQKYRCINQKGKFNFFNLVVQKVLGSRQ